MSVESRGIFLLLITLMGAVALVASDIYLPALPEMTVYFDCSQGEIQTSFSVFLLTLGICQLIYGRLSDKFGRKRILIIGFSLFTLASLFCAFSTTLQEFLFFRILQAIGSGVGSVLSRAIIADRFNRTEAVKIYTTTFPIVGLSPAISPFVGGYLTHFFDWRATFFFMVFFGVSVLLLIAVYLVDKKPDASLQQSSSLSDKKYKYRDIFRNIEFLGFVFIVCAGYSVFRCYTAESPFIFDKQGFVAEEMGYFYITLSLAYLCGNLTVKKLITKLSIDKTLSIGMFFFILGGFSLIISTLFYSDSPLAIIIPMSIVVMGNGFLFPVSSAAAMAAVPANFSGTASGLLGSLQLISAALCISWVGEICGGNAFSMSLYLISIITLGLFSYLLVVYNIKMRFDLTR